MEDITAEAVNEWIEARELARLSPVTLRGIVRERKREGAGELYGLRVEDIDFVRNVVTVDGAYGKVWPKLQRPKTHPAQSTFSHT